MNTRMYVWVAVPLAAGAMLTGCNSKKTSTAPASASSAAPSSTATGGAGKTCPAGSTQGTINGASKCLAAGQECSSKAISSYPQYGFVCENTNGKLTLRRK